MAYSDKVGVTKAEKELLEREQRLKEKLKQTQNALAQKERQRREQERRKERAADTRRKVLVGAMNMEKAKNDPQKAAELLSDMDAFLVRDDDRKLFDLPPK